MPESKPKDDYFGWQNKATQPTMVGGEKKVKIKTSYALSNNER